MSQSPEENQSQATSDDTTVTESDVELLEKTIKRLKDENTQLKMKLGPNYPTDTRVISYLKDVVSKANPDIFDAYTGNTSSSTLSTYSINVDTFLYPIGLYIWVLERTGSIHEMCETIMEAGQRGPLLHPNQALYDSSKTDNLKPPKSKQELSHILHETIEKPAARLVNAVEQKLGSYPNTTCVWYEDHVPEQIESEASKAFAESCPENAKMLDSTSHTQPDACFFGYGKLVMAGLHFDPQSLNVDSFQCFERYYQTNGGLFYEPKDFFNQLEKTKKEEKSNDNDDANLSKVATVFNIIFITYSLMVKYKLRYTYVTTGRCWLIIYKLPVGFRTLYYNFFESKSYTEAAPGKCQNNNTDYQYLKETAFVKLVCLLMDRVEYHRICDKEDTWLAENSKSNASQELETPSPNAKQLYSTDETNGDCSISHRPAKKQKTGHDQPCSDDGFLNYHYLPRPEYCTQKCLLGLKFNGPMHQECPNYVMHKKYSDSDLHPIKNTDLGMLFYRQLKNKRGGFKQITEFKDNEADIFFKITVYPYGYTFVGKGDQHHNRRYSRTEIRIYNKLEKIQGEWIPVYLDYVRFSDNVRFDRLEDRYPKLYLMIFLSYAGESLDHQTDVKLGEEEIEKMKSRLLDLGVFPSAGFMENIVWSKELNHEMVTNLEFSDFL